MKTNLWIGVLALVLASLSLHAQDAPKIGGWKPLKKPSVYNPQNVWNAINGAAEIYLDYGFRELLIQRYKKGKSQIELEIYDQGRAINAFGVFRRERPPKAAGFPIGGEAAVREPYICMMFKGSYLARIKGISGDLNDALCKELLKDVASNLTGEDGFPKELEVLPAGERIANSEGYTPKNYLGITDLPNVLHAKYKGSADEESFELFTIIEPNVESLDKIWQGLSDKWKHTAESGSCSLHRDIPYRGPVILIRQDNRIWGVLSPGDLETSRTWLNNTIRVGDK